ncbi:hypothetical protein [Inquilinus sp. Marseille-Q2685]|uniref:hypothetical protein n=1 Tax=Inquilinus sp. Marseille-Q2685 TaxID=2866581 RepID=UPI001CE49163|nr:hypothetical protein [Inquilinus sp. Marseille-Q2685]
MDMTQTDETGPTDPDMHWTQWALDSLRELVQSDLRTKRMIERQQDRTPAGPDAPDFGLTQSRLSRSVRLSIAMTERIRTDYLMRRDKRKQSGEEQHRRQRRDQAAEAVVVAAAKPDDAEDVEHVRKLVRERLVEDEILDVQLDTLSPEEFVQAVCRRIGRPPPSIPLPWSWDGIAEVVTVGALPAEAADRRPAEGRPQALDDPDTGQLLLEPSESDSS